ncbi:hypothetical protein HHK36_023077 [Tetracentron sinense]|uniref:Protection of telomeres protein 1 n=1 Tax=Tetracentron sinense TaxID=13715 RepID=A0A835D6X1_TETSI|nr:hypothetical protein HHK36_023077 [Tetracentron sinense]
MNTCGNLIQLRDAIDLQNHKVNLLGVVVGFSVPRKSKGTDYVSVLKIIDESHQSPDFSVNIFAENLDDLPHVKSAGDLVQLSCVMMKVHNGEVYAVFNKFSSSFALFEGKSCKDLCPYQASSGYCIRGLDEGFIIRLRTWHLNFQLDAGTSAYLLSLKEIKAGGYFDLICKVLLVCEVSKDVWMLFVWDGTDTQPLDFQMKLEDEAHNPLPLQIESSLPRDILGTFPCVGTILRVIADQAYEKLGLHFQGSGQWVRLRNITCQVCSGLWRGVLVPSSKIQLLSNEDNIVAERQREFNKRISTKCGRVPLVNFPCPSPITGISFSVVSEIAFQSTLTDYEHVPFVTLMDLLTYSEVTAKFKCVVRVVAVYPWRAEDFRSPIGLREYRIRLTLEDPTARIHAFVYAEDGVKFFEGYPPIDVLTSKRNKLLGMTENLNSKEDEDAPRNPPWVECCIKSYYLDKSSRWESRHYRIFGTRHVA